MAKRKKVLQEARAASPAEPGRSVLRAAFEAYERGDMVTARRLALAVGAGTVGRDDPAQAAVLAKELSTAGAVVADSPGDVARALVRLTTVPGKPYIFAAVTVAVFVLLVVLTWVRYQ